MVVSKLLGRQILNIRNITRCHAHSIGLFATNRKPIPIRNLTYRVSSELEISNLNHHLRAQSNIDLRDLYLSVGSDELAFNLTWLRDSCHCDKCTHQHSRQRLLTAKDFHKDMFSIKHLGLVESKPRDVLFPSTPRSHSSFANKWLKIEWIDGHQSHYCLNWLSYVNQLYKHTALNLGHRKCQVDYPEDDFYSPVKDHSQLARSWNVKEILGCMKSIDYHDLVEGFEYKDEATFINANKIESMSPNRFKSIFNLCSQLVINGLAKIVNVPTERNQVLNLVRSLAYERPTGYGTVFDVIVEPSEEINLAYSSVEFDIHSDLTYREISPGVQLLHCIRNSSVGGQSYFSDSLNAAETLQICYPDLFQVLTQFPATFIVRDPYRNVKFRRQQPVISLDFQGKISDIYYSPFMLPPIGFKDDIKLFYLAYGEFTRILQSEENKLICKMEPGELFIFNNRRVLHGRSAYDPKTSSRFLQGCYMDWDEIMCLYEKLKSHENLNASDIGNK